MYISQPTDEGEPVKAHAEIVEFTLLGMRSKYVYRARIKVPPIKPSVCSPGLSVIWKYMYYASRRRLLCTGLLFCFPRHPVNDLRGT